MTAPYGPMPTTGRLVVHSTYNPDQSMAPTGIQNRGRLSLGKPKVSAGVWVSVVTGVVLFGLFLALVFWGASALMS